MLGWWVNRQCSRQMCVWLLDLSAYWCWIEVFGKDFMCLSTEFHLLPANYCSLVRVKFNAALHSAGCGLLFPGECQCQNILCVCLRWNHDTPIVRPAPRLKLGLAIVDVNIRCIPCLKSSTCVCSMSYISSGNCVEISHEHYCYPFLDYNCQQLHLSGWSVCWQKGQTCHISLCIYEGTNNFLNTRTKCNYQRNAYASIIGACVLLVKALLLPQSVHATLLQHISRLLKLWEEIVDSKTVSYRNIWRRFLRSIARNQ